MTTSYIANLNTLTALIQGWAGGIVIIGLIILMAYFFIKKQPRPALVVMATAVVVMAVIVMAPMWFGTSGSMTGIGKKLGDEVNVN